MNLIGEHTDYNRGLCLPFAVEQGVTVIVAPGGGRDALEVHATTLGEVGLFELDSRAPAARAGAPSCAARVAELIDAGVAAPARARGDPERPADRRRASARRPP